MAADKVSARARAEVEQHQAAGERVPVIVRFRNEPAVRQFRSAATEIQAVTAKRNFSMIPAVALAVDPEALDELAEREEVAEVWYDEFVHTMLDVSTPHIGAGRVWEELGYRGDGVVLCVVDTGIDVEHPDFAGRIGLTRDFTGKGSVQDGNGHGTHVASIAAGSGAAGEGTYTGVAPAANLMVAKVLDDNGGGRMSDVMAGVEWAVQQGAQVLNLSLGSDGSSDGQDALSTICNAAVDAGKVMVAAAGNAGPRARTIGSPGAADRVITVGASNDSDGIAIFSSRGPTADGRVKPDVVAPGAGIVAARAGSTSMGSPVNEQYTEANGTSMATPHVAGLCALILQAHPDASPAEVKARLMQAAVDLNADANTQGSGRVDAVAAIQVTPEPEPTPEPDPEPEPTPDPQPQPPGGCALFLLQIFKLLR